VCVCVCVCVSMTSDRAILFTAPLGIRSRELGVSGRKRRQDGGWKKTILSVSQVLADEEHHTRNRQAADTADA